MNNDQIALVAGAGGAGLAIFSLFMPAVALAQNTYGTPWDDHVDNMRASEIMATAATVIVAAAMGKVAGSLIPFFAGVGVAAAMIGAYEWSLRGGVAGGGR